MPTSIDSTNKKPCPSDREQGWRQIPPQIPPIHEISRTSNMVPSALLSQTFTMISKPLPSLSLHSLRQGASPSFTAGQSCPGRISVRNCLDPRVRSRTELSQKKLPRQLSEGRRGGPLRTWAWGHVNAELRKPPRKKTDRLLQALSTGFDRAPELPATARSSRSATEHR